MNEKQDLPTRAFKSKKEWRTWLEKNHTKSTGLWLKIAKKATGIPSVTHLEALDDALCFGWIDGQRDSYDEQYFLQRYTPRRPRSKWSQVNRKKVATLIERGEMMPAGQAQIDAAKADGRWDAAYASQRDAVPSPEFQAALDANPKAAEFFASLTGSKRYAFLYRLHDAKRQETKDKRLKKFIEMLNEGKALN